MRESYTLKERAIILNVKADQECCHFCGKKLIESTSIRTIEHLQPVARGGKTVEDNLVVACEECNQNKGDMTEAEYFRYLEVKENISLEFKDPILKEKDNLKKIYDIEIKLIEQDNLIKKLEEIIKQYKNKRTAILEVKSLISTKLNSLKKERDLKLKTWDIIAKENLGKLKKGSNQVTLSKTLDAGFSLEDIEFLNLAEIEEIVKPIISTNTVKNSTIEDSIVINSTVKNSTVKNSTIEDSTIENSIVVNRREF